MKEILATLTSKGQVTIPITVRTNLGLGTGDKVVFVLDDDGAVHLRRHQYPNVTSLRGAADSLPYTPSWSELRQIAREDRLKEKTSG